MIVSFDPVAWKHYVEWQVRDKAMQRKINALIPECQRHPSEGKGKPEPLKGDLAGYWSRRINREHRLVYKVTKNAIIVVQCRYRY
jgi:toxin YoeB